MRLEPMPERRVLPSCSQPAPPGTGRLAIDELRYPLRAAGAEAAQRAPGTTREPWIMDRPAVGAVRTLDARCRAPDLVGVGDLDGEGVAHHSLLGSPESRW